MDMQSSGPQSPQSLKPSLSILRWVTASIRRFLATIAEGASFSTRDLLSLGSRSAIDSALSRMVAAGTIVRLASGLFMKFKMDDPDWRPPTQEIVQTKLLAFRRTGVAAADTQAETESETSLAPSSAQTVVYEITGNRSQFRLFNGILVQIKSIANRKLDLAQTAVGAKLKNLWQSTKTLCEDSTRKFVTSLGREERADMKALLPLLPQKISDRLGAPWNHRHQVVAISSIRDDCSSDKWFSSIAISQSRKLRTMKPPPPLLELNF